MRLSRHDLAQLDEAGFTGPSLRALAAKPIGDLNEAHDRLERLAQSRERLPGAVRGGLARSRRSATDRAAGPARPRMQHFVRTGLVCCLVAVTASPVFAQPVPNAGSLLREIERSTGKTEIAPAPLTPAEPIPTGVPLPERAGEKVTVTQFRIHATRFPETELQAVLKEYTGREVTLAELQAAARKIGEYYRLHDYLAYAYLPPQTVRNGVIEIVVVEAKLGQVKVDPATHTRLKSALAVGLVARWVPAGGPLRPGKLNEGVGVINELPGVKRAESVLAAGANVGESDAVLRITDGPLARGSLTANNTGSRGTGQWQGYLSGSLDNPFGRGEQVRIDTLGSEGTRYGRLAGSLPLGFSGLQVGVTASTLTYKVKQSVSPLDLNGDSWTAGISLNYPLRRSARFSLTASAGYDYMRFVDRMARIILGDKLVMVGYLGLSATVRDDWHGGGVNNLAVTVNQGQVDLSRNPDQQLVDRVTAGSDGGFSRLNLFVSREQVAGKRVTLSVTLRGQWSPVNLDSSQKFALGGLSGVRAYPTGEAPGDAGWLANLEAKWQLRDTLVLSGFYDVGAVRQHSAPWSQWQGFLGQPNDYILQGLGVGMLWSPVASIQMLAVIAYPIGVNPGNDVARHNSDGANNNQPRAWLQAIFSF